MLITKPHSIISRFANSAISVLLLLLLTTIACQAQETAEAPAQQDEAATQTQDEVVQQGDEAAEVQDETARILALLEPVEGLTVADVGAGEGEWAVPLVDAVGPDGHIYATEVTEENLVEIRKRFEEGDHDNVTVLLGTDTDTGLPDNCCDVLLLRMVYHHFTDPVAMRASLARALRPGGRAVIIDIQPQTHWRQLDDVPDRGGHGILPEALIEEMALDGFEAIEQVDDWNGDEERFGVVFRRAE